MSLSAAADQLREIPLRDVLEWQGLEARPEGIGYRARDQHHNIVATGSQWFDNKAGIGGGGAIDLCRHLTGADFRNACRLLAEEFPHSASVHTGSFRSLHPLKHPRPQRAPFLELASRYALRDESNWPVARAYLIETRRIEGEIIDRLHDVGSIYANDHRPNPSLVFLHRTPNGRVEGATLRDTRKGSAFRPCLGNKLNAWFAVGRIATAKTIVAVESPIDALSYHAMRADNDRALCVVSCAGACVPTELMWQAYDRRQSFVVALDNDPAGERGWRKAWNETADWSGFKISMERPQRKDWNTDLTTLRPPRSAQRLTLTHQ